MNNCARCKKPCNPKTQLVVEGDDGKKYATCSPRCCAIAMMILGGESKEDAEATVDDMSADEIMQWLEMQ